MSESLGPQGEPGAPAETASGESVTKPGAAQVSQPLAACSDPHCQNCDALRARIAELEARLADPGGDRSLPTVEFKALRLLPHGWGEGWRLRPSPARRRWMDELTHAYHCLPLVIANQWGWQVQCPTDVQVVWNGGPGLDALTIDVEPQYLPAIKSQFGQGIVTFSPPWLFRTPRGWDLYLKGPSNRWKANCAPLEGVIETWWLNYTFTINWKLVEPGTVFFARGESLGQLIPVPHATFQDSTALEAPIGLLEPEGRDVLLRWQEERRRIAGTKDNIHKLYRKADGVDEHLKRVEVPEVTPLPGWEGMSPPER